MDQFYTNLTFWYGIPPWELVAAPADWVNKLARHLPRFIDGYFLRMQSANMGAYEASHSSTTPKTRNLKKVDSLASFMKKGKR